jgi:hypothetical protein
MFSMCEFASKDRLGQRVCFRHGMDVVYNLLA